MSDEERLIKLLEEIREEQREFHNLWKRTLYESTKKQKAASRKIWWIIPLILIGSYVIPMLLGPLSTLWFAHEIDSFGEQALVNGAVPSNMKTPQFDGFYSLQESSLDYLEKDFLRQSYIRQYTNFRIHNGLIHSGTELVQEFSIQTGTFKDNVFTGKAMWHEDIHDPGDVFEVHIRLELNGKNLKFSFGNDQNQLGEPIILHKIDFG